MGEFIVECAGRCLVQCLPGIAVDPKVNHSGSSKCNTEHAAKCNTKHAAECNTEHDTKGSFLQGAARILGVGAKQYEEKHPIRPK